MDTVCAKDNLVLFQHYNRLTSRLIRITICVFFLWQELECITIYIKILLNSISYAHGMIFYITKTHIFPSVNISNTDTNNPIHCFAMTAQNTQKTGIIPREHQRIT